LASVALELAVAVALAGHKPALTAQPESAALTGHTGRVEALVEQTVLAAALVERIVLVAERIGSVVGLVERIVLVAEQIGSVVALVERIVLVAERIAAVVERNLVASLVLGRPVGMDLVGMDLAWRLGIQLEFQLETYLDPRMASRGTRWSIGSICPSSLASTRIGSRAGP
jgi:hypothetical protein